MAKSFTLAKLRSTAIGLLLLVCTPAIAAAQEQAAPPTSPNGCAATLDVHVIEAFDHEPVSAANITVNHTFVGSTDEHGRVKVDGLCAGKVVVDVAHDAFEPGGRTISIGASGSVEIELKFKVEEYAVETKVTRTVDMRSTATVSDEALERKRGQSLSETLADVPGVSQLRSGSGLAKPIVRGQFGRRLPIIVDGVRHRAQDWGLDHAPEIDPAIADRISVVRGASGVRYGPDAIGGVVLVDPPDMRRTPGAEGQTHLIGFSNGLGGSLSSRLQAVPAAMPALTLQLEGSVKRQAAARTPDYALDNTGQEQWTAGAALAYRASEAVYQLSYRHLSAELGVCLCYRIDSPSDFMAQIQRGKPFGYELYRADANIDRPYQAIAHDLAVARARWTLGTVGTLTGTYAFQYDHRREYALVRQAVMGPQFAFRLWTHDVDLTFEHTPVHLTDHHHLIGSIGVVGMAQVHSYEGLPLVPDHKGGSAGVFASERLIADEYELEAGVRYDFLARAAALASEDYLRLVRSGQLAADACGTATGATIDCSSKFHTVSASLGGLRRFTNEWSGKLDLSVASRPPNPDEQYLNGTAPSFPVFGLGRPNLGAETSYSASMTATYSSPKLAGEASAFGNYIADYIYFAPAIGPDGMPIFDVLIRGAFPRFVTRPVDAVFYGADGGLTALPLPWLELGGQASLIRARNVTDHSYLVFVPSNNVRSSITLKRPALWGMNNASATVTGSYTARQSRFDLAADLAPPPEAYFLLGGTIQAEKRVGNQTMKFALQGANVLGRRYREYASLMRYFADQPGREVMLRVSLLF